MAAVVLVLLIALASGVAAWRAAGGPSSPVASDGGDGADRGDGGDGEDGPDGPSPDPSASPSAPPRDAALTILAAGDVLPHLAVLESARTASGYDFGPLLAPIDRWVRGADLALCHLEVPVAPPGTEPSGYPLFGAPAQLVDALRSQGWDGCSTASNHSLDRDGPGVEATLVALDAAGLGHAGTGRTRAEAEQPQLYRWERAGRTVTVAHLAATYGTNGRAAPPASPWAVTPLDTAAIVARAAAARAAGADVVLVSVHCCEEYRTEPSPQQVRVAQELAASGVVDLMIGHHAHVPQPVALLPGGPSGGGMWTLYGLGNLLSNQDAQCCRPETSSGLLATAHVVAPAGGPARVTGVEWTGVTVDRHGGHRLHALPDVTGGTPTLSPAEVTTRAAGVAAAVGGQAPLRTTPAEPTGPPPEVVLRTG